MTGGFSLLGGSLPPMARNFKLYDMETNKAILTKLIEHGKRVFESLSIPVGTYTAAELVKANQTGKGNARNIWFQYPEGKGKEILSVSYGSFKVQFETQNIWLYIWKFEQLNSVKQAEKARFTKIEKEQAKPVCTFFVDIPKRATKLKSFVSSDMIRPQLCLVALCPSSGSMVATDSIVMRWENVSFHDYTGEDCEYIYINPKDLPNLVGLCSVSVYKDGYIYKTVVISQTGEIFACTCEGRQPNYKSVIPMVSDDGYIRLSKDGVKDLLSLCKIAKKGNKEAQILFRLSSGSDVIQVSTIGEEWGTGVNVGVSLCAPSKFNAVLCVQASNILTVSSGWNGGIWITGCNKPLIFDNDKVDGLDIVLPLFHDDMMCDEIKGYKNALHRFNPIKINVIQTIKEDVKPSKIKDKEVLSEDKPEPEEKDVISECKEPIKNLPSLYIAPKTMVSGYIEMLVLLIYSLRNWLYEYETAKALSRLEYLAKFSLSDDCAVLDIPKEEECLKADDLECIVSCDVADNSVCAMSDNKESPMCVTSRCTDVVFCVTCYILAVVCVIRSSFGGVSCWLRSRVTKRIRDGTVFCCGVFE